MKVSALIVSVLTLVARTSDAAPAPSAEQPRNAVPASPPASQADQDLARQLSDLETTLRSQTTELTTLKGEVDATLRKKDEGPRTAFLAALAAILAALVAGGVAVWNQNQQARQARFLKAIEIVMESRSAHQAWMRIQNLGVFLDEPTRQHLLEPPGERERSRELEFAQFFAGSEWTDLRLELAKAMSVKASTPQEVLAVWKAALSDKNAINKVHYQ